MNSDARPEQASPVREFGGFRLDLRRRVLYAPTGDLVTLAPRVLETLICMVQNPGVLLRREMLMDSIWPDAAVLPNNLNQNVAKLRRLFGERPRQNRFIETVPGRGYRFIMAVRSERDSGDAAGASGDLEPVDAEARRLYRQALRLLQRPTGDNCRAAVEALGTALTIEPQCALARAWLADAHLLSVNAGHWGREGLDAAERNARRALELMPTAVVAHSVLATVHALRQDWLAAESHFMTAISLDESDAMARALHASFLLQPVGHTRRALAQLRGAFALRPDDPHMLMNLAVSSCIAGHDEDALRHARLAVAFGYPENAYPLSFVFMYAEARASRYGEAAARARELMQVELWQRQVVPAVHAALEDPNAAARAVAALGELLDVALEEVLRARGALPLVVQWLTQLGGMDLAFAAVHRALDAAAAGGQGPPHWQTLWAPEFRRFRAHDRFPAVAARLGFTSYWNIFGPPDR